MKTKKALLLLIHIWISFNPCLIHANDEIVTSDKSGNIILPKGDNNYIINKGNSYIFSGNISGAGSLIKSGSGSLNLSGLNTYTGGTVIKSGILGLQSDMSLGSWVAGSDPFSATEGLVTITDHAVIKVDTNLSIRNHFIIGSGSLTLDIASGKTLTIDGVSTNSDSLVHQYGGAISNQIPGDGALKFTGGNLIFSNNSAEYGGGALGSRSFRSSSAYNFTPLESLIFNNNISAGSGGGISVNSDQTSLSFGNNVLFKGNKADSWGGGLSTQLTGISNITFGNDITFSDNTAGLYGGGLCSYAGSAYYYSFSTVTFGDNIIFSGNTSRYGGGFYSSSGNINTVTFGNNITFKDNKATDIGGGFYSFSALSNVITFGNNVTFRNNRADDVGSALAVGTMGPSGQLFFGNNLYLTGNCSGSRYNKGGSIITSGELRLGGNTFFENNFTASRGSAITMGGLMKFDTHAGDIAFRGNKQGVVFSKELSAGSDNWIPSGGRANSIHLYENSTLAIFGKGNVYFDDPIESRKDVGDDIWRDVGSNMLTKAGTGFVQFCSEVDNPNILNPVDKPGGEVIVREGVFRVVKGSEFQTGGNDGKSFRVTKTSSELFGTLAGGGTIASSNGFVINGSISPDNDRFEVPVFHSENNENYFEPGRTVIDDDKKIGTLVLDGSASFIGATFSIDLGSNNTSDFVSVLGYALFLGGNNIINLQNIESGTFNILSAFGGIWGDVSNFGPVLLNGAPFKGKSEIIIENGYLLKLVIDTTTTSLIHQIGNTKSDVKIYPNPVIDQLNIEGGEESVRSVVITNINGRIVYQSSPDIPFYNLMFEKYPAGIYLVKVITDAGTSLHKIIKN